MTQRDPLAPTMMSKTKLSAWGGDRAGGEEAGDGDNDGDVDGGNHLVVLLPKLGSPSSDQASLLFKNWFRDSHERAGRVDVYLVILINSVAIGMMMMVTPRTRQILVRIN